jgi:DNA repair exonuclease SbcCD ATPase subunit
VNADGRISRHLDQEVLDFKSFSSGEKTVAQLLFRLATLVTTSKVPFCWIDEPLEHLDPASRMVVARTLAFLTKQNYLGQIIVTTYEVDLANKLGHSDRDHVRLEYLGTSQVRS